MTKKEERAIRRAAREKVRAEKEEEHRIRHERRAIKRAEKERGKAERLVRKERHERFRNGAPIIVATQDPTFAALRTYHPLYYCEACRGIKRSDFMFNEEICLACRDGARRPRMKMKTMHPGSLLDENARETEKAGELFAGIRDRESE